jgi:hypothetical protein
MAAVMAGWAQQQPAAPPPSAQTDAIAEFVRKAQADIEESIERGGLHRDQYRHPMRALSSALSVFPELVRQLKASAEGPRQPVDQETLQELGRTALILVERQAGELLHARVRKLVLSASLAAFAIAATGFGLGWVAHGGALQRECMARGSIQADKDSGRRYCAFWLDLAPGKGQ